MPVTCGWGGGGGGGGATGQGERLPRVRRARRSPTCTAAVPHRREAQDRGAAGDGVAAGLALLAASRPLHAQGGKGAGGCERSQASRQRGASHVPRMASLAAAVGAPRLSCTRESCRKGRKGHWPACTCPPRRPHLWQRANGKLAGAGPGVGQAQGRRTAASHMHRAGERTYLKRHTGGREGGAGEGLHRSVDGLHRGPAGWSLKHQQQ